MTNWKSQQIEGKYYLQFETDDKEKYRLVEEAAQMAIDGIKAICGTCAYAKHTTFGRSKIYVECTNQEHIEKFCKREIAKKRARTTRACKCYKMTELKK